MKNPLLAALRNSSLTIALMLLFALSLVGHAITGWRVDEEERLLDHEPLLSFLEYLGSGHFIASLFENWESEFLQMALYVGLTVFLFQKGSAESKDPEPTEEEESDEDPRLHADDPDAPGPVRAGGWMLKFYSCSLTLALALFFLLSWVMHAVGGFWHYQREQLKDGLDKPTFGDFLASAQFWFESFQNWQSEFLSVAALVVLSIFLRQWGSPESKPVHFAHSRTGKG